MSLSAWRTATRAPPSPSFHGEVSEGKLRGVGMCTLDCTERPHTTWRLHNETNCTESLLIIPWTTNTRSPFRGDFCGLSQCLRPPRTSSSPSKVPDVFFIVVRNAAISMNWTDEELWDLGELKTPLSHSYKCGTYAIIKDQIVLPLLLGFLWTGNPYGLCNHSLANHQPRPTVEYGSRSFCT